MQARTALSSSPHAYEYEYCASPEAQLSGGCMPCRATNSQSSQASRHVQSSWQ